MNAARSKTERELTYTEALDELDTILGEIEGEDVDLDRLAERVERAALLVQLLKQRIRATELKVARVVEELREASAEDAPDADEDRGNTDRENPEHGDGGGPEEGDPLPF